MVSMLTNHDQIELTAFRRALHKYPELSGEEFETAKKIKAALEQLSPTIILSGLGGHGVAAVFDSGVAGPTVLFRAELDALPIEEQNDVEWSSVIAGKSHVCGHDGHMTMLLGLGQLISRTPVARGRIVLLFQPQKKTVQGQGRSLPTQDLKNCVPIGLSPFTTNRGVLSVTSRPVRA